MPPTTPMIIVNVAGNFSDPDGEPLIFMISSFIGNPAIATIGPSSGIVTISRNPNQTGAITVAITATDAKGASVWDEFQVEMQ